jgi:hypothetical protein
MNIESIELLAHTAVTVAKALGVDGPNTLLMWSSAALGHGTLVDHGAAMSAVYDVFAGMIARHPSITGPNATFDMVTAIERGFDMT